MKLQKQRVKKMSEEDLDKSNEKYQYKQINSICTTYLAFCYRNVKFWAEFGYGKYLIVPFWYASAAYQAVCSRHRYYGEAPSRQNINHGSTKLG